MGISQPTSYKTGLWAERLAAFYLRLKGYEILHTRYKTKVGEVDLVARKRDTIAFVEVKARSSVDVALSSVPAPSRKRIARAAEYFLMSEAEKFENFHLRFDVIAIGSKWPFGLKHLDNAWQVPS